MDMFVSKRCTCLLHDVNNYPDVAMSTDCYFPRHKSEQSGAQCSKRNQETWTCSSALCSLTELEDRRSNICGAFQGNDPRLDFDCDASRRLQVKFISNNGNNNRKRLFRAIDEVSRESNQDAPRVRNCQQCSGPTFQSFSKTDENSEFKDVFDSFELLNRKPLTDSTSVRSSLSDEQLENFQIPNSRMRKMKARDVRKERIKTSSCLRLTTTNKYGCLVAIMCFIVVVFVLIFLVTWTAFHRREQCIPPSQVHSNFGSPSKVAGVSMNLSTDEDYGEGWGIYREGGSRYKTFDVTTNFEAAQEFCERRGGHLPRIETIREQVFIEEFLQQNTKHEMRADNHQRILGFWIGGRRPRGSHGGGCMFDQWKWVDLYGRVHGSISGFTAFAQGKPDNIFDPEECLYIVHEEGLGEASNFKWDDTACDVSSLGGIKVFCEVELR